MPEPTILFRSHANPSLTLRRIQKWHEMNPSAHIVFYDGTGGQLGIRDDTRYNLTVYPKPRIHHYGYPQLFDAFRWLSQEFPGSICHYTEYDSVPVKPGYLDALELHPGVVLGGESSRFDTPGFREWYEDCRFRAVEAIGKILNVPVRMSYAFGPSIILGASCVKYLGLFHDDDFERHIYPALDRIRRDYIYDEVVLMSLLIGRGYRREFNPAAKFILFESCDELSFAKAQRDGEAFAVHAVKTDEIWAR